MGPSLEVINAHPRDKRISIVNNGRVRYYLIDGKKNKYLSTTERLSIFWNKPFPKDEKWGPPGNPFRVEKERLNAETAIFGNFCHTQFEQYENGLKFKPDPRYPQYKNFEDLPNWPKFMQFKATLEPYWKVFRTEWFIFTKQYRNAGTADIVYRDMRYPDKLVLMVVDYKTSKDPLGFFCDCKGDARERENPDPNSHYPNCSAVGQHPSTRGMLSTKCNKDFSQVCVYSKIFEDLYATEQFPEVIVSQAIVVYLNAEPAWPLFVHTDDRTKFTHIVEELLKYMIKKPQV